MSRFFRRFVWGGNTDHSQKSTGSAAPLGAAPYIGEQAEHSRATWETPVLKQVSDPTSRKSPAMGVGGKPPDLPMPPEDDIGAENIAAALSGSTPVMSDIAIARLADSDVDD